MTIILATKLGELLKKLQLEVEIRLQDGTYHSIISHLKPILYM